MFIRLLSCYVCDVVAGLLVGIKDCAIRAVAIIASVMSEGAADVLSKYRIRSGDGILVKKL